MEKRWALGRRDVSLIVAVDVWGFPKIRGTILGVSIMRIIVFGGLYWIPVFWETTRYSCNTTSNRTRTSI